MTLNRNTRFKVMSRNFEVVMSRKLNFEQWHSGAKLKNFGKNYAQNFKVVANFIVIFEPKNIFLSTQLYG